MSLWEMSLQIVYCLRSFCIVWSKHQVNGGNFLSKYWVISVLKSQIQIHFWSIGQQKATKVLCVYVDNVCCRRGSSKWVSWRNCSLLLLQNHTANEGIYWGINCMFKIEIPTLYQKWQRHWEYNLMEFRV